MRQPLILASGSKIRADLLRQACVPHETAVARIDEDTIKQSLIAEEATPRDIADTLAEMKARKVSDKYPGALVLGCDQVLDHHGVLLSKPENEQAAIKQLGLLSNDRHSLLSAAVLYEDGKPVWRHVGQVRLRMRTLSDDYISDYIARNWESIRHAVGSYKLEEEGVRFFTSIEGDYFHVLGMPLLELINYLTLRGDLAT
ncbi:Maf-like protein [Sulfitobacter noctilucicola]|uniref:Nucleoside triphosphate pyrophosphatase n=1 Tax=Sulfitobacter noctilucicola TaxID=1342301 RepID=A0A7W6Q220_9RHOB|nr:Maf family protein [Sulfitobacter noctilucicola]KIN62829.1 Maf-like protein [Sulfitobacter noctilucicola]MBB4172640.1 septum formation protein [Sulfitobacter noctilucicola]